MISWLLQPLVQIVDKNGNPVVGAKVYVYYSTPEILATIYSDDAGTEQENPVLTDTLGNVTIFADTEYLYDVIVYDPNGNLLFGKKHIAPASLLDVSSNEVKVEAGEGIIVTKTVSEGQITYTVSCDFDIVGLAEDIANKQDKLEAGDNIEITNNNVINVVNRKTIRTVPPIEMTVTDSHAIISLDTDQLVDYIDLSDYIPWSATNLPIGSDNSVSNIGAAVGVRNIATREGYAFGNDNNAVSASFAIGSNNVAQTNSFDCGSYNIATNQSLAQGYSNSATNNSVVFGYNNIGDNTSFIHGFDNNASFQSQILGFRNHAATNSTVIGFDNTAIGSRIIGFSNTGNYSKIFGDNCSANNAIFVAGNSNIATVSQSYAIGAGLSVQNCSAAMGTYNNDLQGAKFVYGVGTDVNNRKNAFWIDNNDNIVIPQASVSALNVNNLSVNQTSEWVDYTDGYTEYSNTAASTSLTFNNLFYIPSNQKIIAEILIPNLVFNPYGTFGNGQVKATLYNDSDHIIWESYYPLWGANMAVNIPVLYHNKTNNAEHIYLTLSTTTDQQFAAATRKLYLRGGNAKIL